MKPADGVPFAGLENFQHIFSKSETFWTSLRNSTVLTVGTVGGSLVVGLILALILDGRFLGIGLVRGFFILPWAVPTVVAAMIWVWILNFQFGSVNSLLATLSIMPQRIAWFREKRTAMASMIVAHIRLHGTYLSLIVAYASFSIPFCMWLLKWYFATIPKELEDAARVDGTGRIGALFRIVIPLSA